MISNICVFAVQFVSLIVCFSPSHNPSHLLLLVAGQNLLSAESRVQIRQSFLERLVSVKVKCEICYLDLAFY